ncbi:hypothetical protein N7486_002188 [Penicillium sp. IBT 16267x]|nr:hypothetical protein N7486_002188 [Penicillium sp. IBT 16267x]
MRCAPTNSFNILTSTQYHDFYITFTPSTVRHSFKHCGLWPFDPEVICKDLRLDDGPDLVVYDRGKEYKLPQRDFNHSRLVEEGEEGDIVEGDPETPPPASSSTINSPPTTVAKLQKNIAKARESFPNNNGSKINKLKRRVERIWEESILQAQLAAQVSAELIRLQESQEQANAKKSKRQSSKGGALRVRDSNNFIRNRDIVEAEKERRKYERDAKQLSAEMLRRTETMDQKNQRREAELEWVNGDDGQPLYTIDRRGGYL